MKVLVVGNFQENDSVNGGYNNASDSIYRGFKYLKDNKKIKKVSKFEVGKTQLFKNEIYDICILNSHPSQVCTEQGMSFITNLKKNVKKIYLNVLWETMPLPSTWGGLFDKNNNIIDGFVASSYFILSQLLHKTEKDLYYLPYCINVPKEYYVDIEEKLNEKYFTCLFIGQNTSRKGVNEAITSYSRLFSGTKDARLIIKSHGMSPNELPINDKINSISRLNSKTDNLKIYNLERNLKQKEIYQLYKSSSLFLFTSRGEGFGYPAIEANTIGIPVVYTNWSSLRETGGSEANFPVKYNLDEAVDMLNYGYEYFSQYAYPQITSIMESMFIAYSVWKKDRIFYYTESLKNRKFVEDNFSLEKIADYSLNIVEENNKVTFKTDNKYLKLHLEDYNICQKKNFLKNF